MTALYRKYRPQTFHELVGQTPIRVTLLEALKQNRLAHAYLFSGPRGTGKTSTARLVARAIQCENRLETGEPCGTCEICTMSLEGSLVDLVEIDAASNRGIDEIRDLREKMRYAPTRATSKVYIIDEVHMLTKEAFNALLKSLEEPPPHVFFILATTEIHKVPETILSRCQRYEFKRIAEKDIVAQLAAIAEKEGRDYEAAALELLARHAEGGMRDAISLFEQLSNEKLTVALVEDRLGLSNLQYCDQLYGALGSMDSAKGLALIEDLHREGADLSQFTVAFLKLLRGKMHEAVALKKSLVLPKLLVWIDLFDDAWVKLKRASIATLPLEIAVVRATETVGTEDSPPPSPSNKAPLTSTASLKSSPTESKPLESAIHVDAMRQQLPKVISILRSPAVRVSFGTGQIKDVKDKEIRMSFSSQFHLQQVSQPSAIGEIEEAFCTIFGPGMKVFCDMDAVASVPAPSDTLEWEMTEESLPS